MKIAVIGTGYVGLTTGTCFAEMGNEVICMDVDEKKISDLTQGIIPIYEPGLEELVKRNTREKRLRFSTNCKEAVEFAEIVFSAVGTPPLDDNKPNLEYVKQVAKEFGKHLNEYKLFVNKSTVPVGTGNLCQEIIQEELDRRGVDFDFDAVSNPEFLKEGSAIKDTMHPDRIVIGYETKRAKKLMKRLYRALGYKGVEMLFTDLKTAEIIKYASNAALATKISFINEIANFCEKCGGNVQLVAKGIGLDKRIGKRFLNAGIGYGGSCFPKDTKALIQMGKEYDHDFKIITAVDKVNDRQKKVLYHKLKAQLGDLSNKTIAIWGLSFKPGTDDMREAPSKVIIEKLQNDGAQVQAFDPVARNSAKACLSEKNITYFNTSYEALSGADALMLLTEWDEFRFVDLKKVKELMKGKLILDGRNIFEKEEVVENGLDYVCIGQSADSTRPHQNIDKATPVPANEEALLN